ncbi:MAG: CatB-related O-acetyltransferase [Mucilaginibacter sp.]|uniref:CatB-related O-acetyltransferase n=1 Tax=Mucilaginibacter sp. TaxID=1882438 RepID=UPI0031B178B0
MSFLNGLKILFKNSKSLLLGTATGRLHWDYFTSQQVRCNINPKSKISKVHYLFDVSVGFGTAIGPNARISQTSVGKFCSLGPNLVCGWGIHPINGISTSPAFYSVENQVGFTYSKTNKVEERKHITIGNDVFIGANVTILDGANIADGAVIGAGAVVSKDIPPYAIAVGCPIKVIGYRFDEDKIAKLLQIKWWDRDEETYKKVEELFFDVDEFLKQF